MKHRRQTRSKREHRHSFIVVASSIFSVTFSELARIFLLDDYRENLKNGVLVDLYYYTIQFARDHKFKKEQTSAFFSLVKQTHEVCIGGRDVVSIAEYG